MRSCLTFCLGAGDLNSGSHVHIKQTLFLSHLLSLPHYAVLRSVKDLSTLKNNNSGLQEEKQLSPEFYISKLQGRVGRGKKPGKDHSVSQTELKSLKGVSGRRGTLQVFVAHFLSYSETANMECYSWQSNTTRLLCHAESG